MDVFPNAPMSLMYLCGRRGEERIGEERRGEERKGGETRCQCGCSCFHVAM
jgi:hypothetical protein